MKTIHNRVGLGTFPLAGVFNKITTKDAEKLVQSFIGQGGYYIDTAPLYGFGEVEELLGRALKKFLRESYYLITKAGKVIAPDKRVINSSKREDVIRECDSSLQRLGLDFIDLYMIHSPDQSTPFEETMEAMHTLEKAGKIGAIAVSNVSLEELKEYGKYAKISYVQNSFSMINRSIDRPFGEYLRKHDIFLIPYHLLAIGQLTGIAFENYRLRKGDLREKVTFWNSENQDVIFSWVRESLAPVAKGLGITIGQLNIAWALYQPSVDFVVVGTTKEQYLPINLNANSINLPENSLKQIEEAYARLETDIMRKYGKTVHEFRGLNDKYC